MLEHVLVIIIIIIVIIIIIIVVFESTRLTIYMRSLPGVFIALSFSVTAQCVGLFPLLQAGSLCLALCIAVSVNLHIISLLFSVRHLSRAITHRSASLPVELIPFWRAADNSSSALSISCAQ